jgi:hypothetical protein
MKTTAGRRHGAYEMQSAMDARWIQALNTVRESTEVLGGNQQSCARVGVRDGLEGLIEGFGSVMASRNGDHWRHRCNIAVPAE